MLVNLGMNFDSQTNTWHRTCPACGNDVSHKTKGAAREGERHSKPCKACADKLLSKKFKKEFSDGTRQAWTVGLTEETDTRLKEKNDAARKKYESGEIVVWHKGKTIKEDPRIAKLWLNRNPTKEYENVRWSNEEIEELLKNNTFLCLEHIENYTHYRNPSLWVKCKNCEFHEKVSLYVARTDRCPVCSPIGSNGQNEIVIWLETLGLVIERNTKHIASGRQEIDIYIPSHKFAIEFNGLYYHNEAAGKDSKYHQNKSDKCNELGITLFHVFEDEWYKKQDIIKSMITHRLGLSQHKVSARSCVIVELSSKDKKKFFNTNHIDGNVPSTVAFGLMHDSVIVSAMSLRRPYLKRCKGLEVARSCSTLDTIVNGGLSKLTAHVKSWAKSKGHETLTTYVDTRFGIGKGYENAGWTLISKTPPRFWWTDSHKRVDRLKFKADKKHGMTEVQVAEKAGVSKIWGCKNLVYEMKL